MSAEDKTIETLGRIIADTITSKEEYLDSIDKASKYSMYGDKLCKAITEHTLDEYKPASREEQEELDKFIEAIIKDGERIDALDADVSKLKKEVSKLEGTDKKSFMQKLVSRFKRR